MSAEQALQKLIRAENAIANYEARLKRYTFAVKNRIAQLKMLEDEARAELEVHLKQSSELNANGEPIITLSGGMLDYVVSYTTPRRSVKVVDVEAVPDEFCKIERKPILTEIAKAIEAQPVKWASFEWATPAAQWKAKKK